MGERMQSSMNSHACKMATSHARIPARGTLGERRSRNLTNLCNFEVEDLLLEKSNDLEVADGFFGNKQAAIVRQFIDRK